MADTNSAYVPTWAAELRDALRQLRDETLIWMLPGLILLSLALFSSLRSLSDPIKGSVLGGSGLLLALVVWGIQKLNYPAAAWVLVLGGVGLNVLTVTWGGLIPVLYLLVIPVITLHSRPWPRGNVRRYTSPPGAGIMRKCARKPS